MKLFRSAKSLVFVLFAFAITTASAVPAKATAASAPLPAAICQTRGNVDPYFVDLVNRELARIPDELLAQFQNDGWWIAVTDEDIDAVYYGGQFGSVMGTTQWDDHYIVIEDREHAIYESTIHEFGHYVDCRAGGISSSEEFLNIYYAETDSFCSTFAVNFYYNNEEFFAEAFWKYYTDPTALRAGCPQTYAWFDSYLA